MCESDIGHVAWWAKMYSLVAKMESLRIRALGMEAFNRFRAMQGFTEGYGQEEFEVIANEIEKISLDLAKI